MSIVLPDALLAELLLLLLPVVVLLLLLLLQPAAARATAAKAAIAEVRLIIFLSLIDRPGLGFMAVRQLRDEQRALVLCGRTAVASVPAGARAEPTSPRARRSAIFPPRRPPRYRRRAVRRRLAGGGGRGCPR